MAFTTVEKTQTRILCLNVYSKQYLQSIWNCKSLGMAGEQHRQQLQVLGPAFCYGQPVAIEGTGQNSSKMTKISSGMGKTKVRIKPSVCQLQLTWSVQVVRAVLEEEAGTNPPSTSQSKLALAATLWKEVTSNWSALPSSSSSLPKAGWCLAVTLQHLSTKAPQSRF